MSSSAAVCIVLVIAVLFLNSAFCEENVTCIEAKSCEECVKSLSCYWCNNDHTCNFYKYNRISTYFDHCTWGDARWQFCWLNVMAMVISCSVLGAIFLIGLIACCCWCSSKCKKRKQQQLERDEAEMERKEEERRIKSDDRKAERKTRTDEIRTKYGLLKEEGE